MNRFRGVTDDLSFNFLVAYAGANVVVITLLVILVIALLVIL